MLDVPTKRPRGAGDVLGLTSPHILSLKVWGNSGDGIIVWAQIGLSDKHLQHLGHPCTFSQENLQGGTWHTREMWRHSHEPCGQLGLLNSADKGLQNRRYCCIATAAVKHRHFRSVGELPRPLRGLLPRTSHVALRTLQFAVYIWNLTLAYIK
jgi:hypothetical protein